MIQAYNPFVFLIFLGPAASAAEKSRGDRGDFCLVGVGNIQMAMASRSRKIQRRRPDFGVSQQSEKDAATLTRPLENY